MELYGVVTMDVAGSRNIQKRDLFQDRLISYIKFINDKYAAILAAPISITLGDEWQLITYRPSQCYNLVHEFQQLLWMDGVEFYAGIGIGSIDTSLYEDTRKMDGPCFHMSREAINIVKRKRADSRLIYSKHNRVFFKSQKHTVHGENEFIIEHLRRSFGLGDLEEAALTSLQDSSLQRMMDALTLDNLINILIENNEILKSRMTQKQKKVYIDYLKLGSYRKMTQKTNESIGGISQKLNSAEFFTIQRNHEMVEMLLRYHCALKGVKY